MPLKKIFESWEIDALNAGDRVVFVPEEIERGYDNEVIFLRRPNPHRLNFVVLGKNGRDIHLLGYCRISLAPTQSGLIKLKEGRAFIHEQRRPEDPDYEMYKNLIEQSKRT